MIIRILYAYELYIFGCIIRRDVDGIDRSPRIRYRADDQRGAFIRFFAISNQNNLAGSGLRKQPVRISQRSSYIRSAHLRRQFRFAVSRKNPADIGGERHRVNLIKRKRDDAHLEAVVHPCRQRGLQKIIAYPRRILFRIRTFFGI